MKKFKFNYVARQRLILYFVILMIGIINAVLTLTFFDTLPNGLRGLLSSISAGIFTSVIMAYFVDNISSRVQYDKYRSSRNMFLGMVKDSMVYMFRLLSRTLYQISSTTAPMDYIEVLDTYGASLQESKNNYVDKKELAVNKYLDGYRYAVTQLAKELYNFFSKKDLLILHGIVDKEKEWEYYDKLKESLNSIDLQSVNNVEELDDVIESLSDIKKSIDDIVSNVEEFASIKKMKFQKYKIIE